MVLPSKVSRSIRCAQIVALAAVLLSISSVLKNSKCLFCTQPYDIYTTSTESKSSTSSPSSSSLHDINDVASSGDSTDSVNPSILQRRLQISQHEAASILVNSNSSSYTWFGNSFLNPPGVPTFTPRQIKAYCFKRRNVTVPRQQQHQPSTRQYHLWDYHSR